MVKTTLKRQYQSLYEMIKMVPQMIQLKRKRILSKQFFERLMLAVTEVNGCDVCSYGHTKMALESGMSEKEIRALLAGEHNEVPDAELEGVFFAQYYAESAGRVSESAWQRVIEVYGEPKSLAILAVVRTIMFGNFYGIPLSRILRRFKGERGICVLLEVLRELSFLIFLPIALFQNFGDCLTHKPLIQTEK